MHHPVVEKPRTPFDEKFTVPVRMAQHRALWRTVQTLKNTPETLRQIRHFIDALFAEYLIRLRELRIKGELDCDRINAQYIVGGENDGKTGEFQSECSIED